MGSSFTQNEKIDIKKKVESFLSGSEFHSAGIDSLYINFRNNRLLDADDADLFKSLS
jgi:hypothetical protein